MKTFLFRCLLFLVPLLLANVPAYYVVNDVTYGAYKPPQDLSRFDHFLLADSHGFVLQDALSAYGILNLSNNSDNYADAYRKIAYMIRRQMNVKTIYLTADEHTLSSYREDAPNTFMSVYYYADYESYKKSVPSTNPFTFVYAKYMRPFLPLLQTDNAYFINNFFVRKIKGEDAFVNGEILWDTVSQRDALTKARIENQYRTNEKSAELKSMLLKVSSLCKTHGIELVGLKFPLTRDYLEELGSRSYHADSVFMQQGLRIIDAQKIYLNQNSYFKDQDHLNETGVQKFAAAFADSINKNQSNQAFNVQNSKPIERSLTDFE